MQQKNYVQNLMPKVKIEGLSNTKIFGNIYLPHSDHNFTRTKDYVALLIWNKDQFCK